MTLFRPQLTPQTPASRLVRTVQRQERGRGLLGEWLRRTLPFLPLALLTLTSTAYLTERFLPDFSTDNSSRRVMEMVVLDPEPPPEEEELEEEEEEKTPDLDGQLVELAPPEEEEIPEEADYLAEANQTVEEETRIDEFLVNPEVVAPVFSEEQKAEQEDLLDLNVDKPSTGATAGERAFDPQKDGNMSALPSNWQVTNREGPQDPVPSSHSSAQMSGAPQNDLINERIGDQVALNTKEYLYAGYLLEIRRLVNFYWQQNLDNLPPTVRFAKDRYLTRVSAVLDRRGGLEVIKITAESGSEELDTALTQAFKMASPFPSPPEGLIEKDGRVYLPPMSYTVRLGKAQLDFQGVDPRAGVQFPGIQKSPR